VCENDQVSIAVSCSRHVRLIDVARWKSGFWKLRDFPFTLFCSRLWSADWLVCRRGEIGDGCHTRFRVSFLCLFRRLLFLYLKRLLQGLGRPPGWGSFAAHERLP